MIIFVFIISDIIYFLFIHLFIFLSSSSSIIVFITITIIFIIIMTLIFILIGFIITLFFIITIIISISISIIVIMSSCCSDSCNSVFNLMLVCQRLSTTFEFIISTINAITLLDKHNYKHFSICNSDSCIMG